MVPNPIESLQEDAAFSLHDGEIQELTVDRQGRRVHLVVHSGNLQVGYWFLTFEFRDACIVPENYQLLAFAIGARYRSDHWGNTVTVIRRQELREHEDRFVLRLTLWPFHRFAIDFATVAINQEPAGPFANKPGAFRFTS